ncbi:MAG: translation elongation factor 4 [Spirochaetaceae bacterium]
MMERDYVRNFCIIAHIDHGKSTLADRLIERARIIDQREFKDQLLDSMDIERERGISIKSHAVTIPHRATDGNVYELNLVDTPGHVDFSYEVSRAIASSEGALLLVDATQGVQAQTLSNMYMALEHNLEIIPVINKTDLPGAMIEETRHQIEHDLGLDPGAAVEISAKTGAGIDELLEAIVILFPPPAGDPSAALRARVFDSNYDPYRGVIAHLRIVEGTLAEGDRVRIWSNQAEYTAEEVGRFRIGLHRANTLYAGDVGYLIAGIKTITDVKVGDTITDAERPCAEPLSGFREAKPVVFSSVYPTDADEYDELARAMEKLKLNDASFVFEKDTSAALGFGFRCGFLGLLHLEVVQERLEREFDLGIILTAPSVRYRIKLRDGSMIQVENPQDFPAQTEIEQAEEPYIRASVITPDNYLGTIITLCTDKRGTQEDLRYLDEKRVELVFSMPLAEVLFDFYDKLKSVSRGYASLDYEITDYRPTNLVKLEILVNGKPVDALAQLVVREQAEARARQICRRLKDEIPRHQFKIPVQGMVAGNIIARETVPALRKDVTAKCYGGDITRKRKLLEKQKAGKKRMQIGGNVEVPQTAFLSVLKSEES